MDVLGSLGWFALGMVRTEETMILEGLYLRKKLWRFTCNTERL